MAVVSNKPEDLVVKICGKLGVRDFFTCIYGPESLNKMKPDPEGLFKFLNMIGVSSEHSLMVGDSYTDIQAGKSAKCHTCGVLYGIGDTNELIEERADFYIRSMEELFQFID